jgi:hypothetical protein
MFKFPDHKRDIFDLHNKAVELNLRNRVQPQDEMWERGLALLWNGGIVRISVSTECEKSKNRKHEPLMVKPSPDKPSWANEDMSLVCAWCGWALCA